MFFVDAKRRYWGGSFQKKMWGTGSVGAKSTEAKELHVSNPLIVSVTFVKFPAIFGVYKHLGVISVQLLYIRHSGLLSISAFCWSNALLLL